MDITDENGYIDDEIYTPKLPNDNQPAKLPNDNQREPIYWINAITDYLKEERNSRNHIIDSMDKIINNLRTRNSDQARLAESYWNNNKGKPT